MARFATHEAQAHLSELVQRASRGETIFITESGQAMAKLVAADETFDAKLSEEQVVAALQEIRSRTRLVPGETLRALIVEGRKY